MAKELENYFENTIIPQLFVDANLILIKFTPAAKRQFNLVQDDIGKMIDDIADKICYPTIINNIQEVISSGRNLEKEIQTTDLKWYQMNISSYIDTKENRANGVLITFVDITKRIKTLKELEKLNADHTIYTYSVSHDIRQPLFTLGLVAEALEDAFSKNDNNSFKSYIEIHKRSVNSIKVIIDALTVPVNNDVEGSKTDELVNIEDIYEDITLALKDEIHKNKINIIRDFNTKEIQFSRKNLRSIFYNLISNAIKYKNKNKPLEIFIKSCMLNNYVRLSVKDNGLGIDKPNHEIIFRKYSRINSETEGTGIGLYLVRTMIENSGGKIELESALGEGSTFHVYFKS